MRCTRLDRRSAFNVRLTAIRWIHIAKLGVTAESGQGAENLNPDLLCDVGGIVRIANEASDDRVYARRILRPEYPQCPLVPLNCAPN